MSLDTYTADLYKSWNMPVPDAFCTPKVNVHEPALPSAYDGLSSPIYTPPPPDTPVSSSSSSSSIVHHARGSGGGSTYRSQQTNDQQIDLPAAFLSVVSLLVIGFGGNFMLGVARNYSPYLFNTLTSSLGSVYYAMVVPPLKAGAGVLAYIASCVHAYFPKHGFPPGWLIVCLMLAILIGAIVMGIRRINDNHKFAFPILLGIFAIPFGLYAVCILALNIGAFGDYAVRNMYDYASQKLQASPSRVLDQETEKKFLSIKGRIDRE